MDNEMATRVIENWLEIGSTRAEKNVETIPGFHV